MIILDKPFISQFMQDTIAKMGIPALLNEAATGMDLNPDINLIPEEEFIAQYKAADKKILYTVSENSLGWVLQNLAANGFAEKVSFFKDKYKFRKILAQDFPDYHFEKLTYEELDTFDPTAFKTPFIVKPTRGFFSVAVHQVDSYADWPRVVREIKASMKSIAGVFPEDVLNAGEFIVEDCVCGEEFAIDAYFDQNGEPVILNIMKHEFAHEGDTSDRLYYTSRRIIEEKHALLQKTLKIIGTASGVTNFPTHVELRITAEGDVGLIEANALRFAGLCVTDLSYFAYGMNNYEYFFSGLRPDWDVLLKDKDLDTKYAMIVGDFPSDVDTNRIESIDYDGFASRFSKLLEMRKVDYRNIPLFTISFAQFDASNKEEFHFALESDFREFIRIKK